MWIDFDKGGMKTMELQEAMNIRKSVRSYTGEQISREQLDSILTAAYEAPIGMGKYDSIHFTIITNPELLKEIDANAAKFFGNPSMHPLYGAPMLIVISSNSEGNVASANVGFILQNMSLAAVEEGIGHCDIYGAIAALSQDKVLLGKLNIPDGFTPLGALAVGKTTEVYTKREIPAGHKYGINEIQ